MKFLNVFHMIGVDFSQMQSDIEIFYSRIVRIVKQHASKSTFARFLPHF